MKNFTKHSNTKQTKKKKYINLATSKLCMNRDMYSHQNENSSFKLIKV